VSTEQSNLKAQRRRINEMALAAESELVNALVAESAFDPALRNKITAQTATLVSDLRREGATPYLQSFLSEYGLSTAEGVALMSMAEAFLRVPDAKTVDDLIAEKITGSNWQSHSGQASSFLVNASTWALMLTGRLLDEAEQVGLVPAMGELLRRLGEPVVRVAMTEAMEQLGSHFVVGTSIDHALKRTAKDSRYRDYSFSFDMLGESALTESDAEHYFESYKVALNALAKVATDDLQKNSGISVKLSALHPRFELTQKTKTFDLLLQRVSELAQMAAASNLNLNIDGEEAERMELTLDIFSALAEDEHSKDWQGLGLVVQAYARNAIAIINWLTALAEKNQRKFMVRLVKGAYWDTEIKRAQVLGLESYPVFTRKPHTDVSYLCVVEKMLRATDALYPQFATHNAHSVTAIIAMAEKLGVDNSLFEFQRLYGMGEQLHEIAREKHHTNHRVYAPVGEHEDLLAYLVRRLLENGANSSFVHQLTDDEVPVEVIAADPFTIIEGLELDDSSKANSDHSISTSGIVAPEQLYTNRKNSIGFDLANSSQLDKLDAERDQWKTHTWHAHPLLLEKSASQSPRQIFNPALPTDEVGTVEDTAASDIETAITHAVAQTSNWSGLSVADRADCLNKAADLFEAAFGEFAALLIREAGKTMSDVVGEWREAIDFLRFYAEEAQSNPELQQRSARGVFLCIAPWNFPLSIFTGQIAAALVTGNTVLAKPAEQANLVAFKATQLLHQAGIPLGVLQLLLGDGETVGARLSSDSRINGICFTGSTEVAQLINKASINAEPDLRLIAETGGINAMIVDSTALPEQTVRDIITSAFYSAGQRCSALRIVYLQEDIADRFVEMLLGAMNSLTVGDPWEWETDIGPAIDQDAQNMINKYVDAKNVIHSMQIHDGIEIKGSFVPPSVIEVNGIADLEQEIFGPVLHVARYKSVDLDDVIEDINNVQYGLTFSIHTRLTQKVDRVIKRLNIGNVYVNRNQIGAVVESQPFGGQGLSGTGPKAGGPLYLTAFTKNKMESSDIVSERHLQQLTAAQLDKAIADIISKQSINIEDALTKLNKLYPEHQAVKASAIETNRRMAGPTGERNIYELRSVGVCLCLGPSADQALTQALQVLAFGGTALLCCESTDELRQAVTDLENQDLAVSLLEGYPRNDALDSCKAIEAVSYVITEATIDEARRIRKALAEREGPIVRFITELLNPFDYVHEVHVCNDITSSGGNVELMALS
jgi:RHH-type transcriptional regulator, proline utilization regulon repressor / proline dehydrogenase / delta 1-pyrroline-5-carboxylate dehydrogenase